MACSGGNSSYADPNGTEISCGYAPVLEVIYDHERSAPAWFSGGAVDIDSTMVSPLQCQSRCLHRSGCQFFSYEVVQIYGVFSHECLLKGAFTDQNCLANPYVPRRTRYKDGRWNIGYVLRVNCVLQTVCCFYTQTVRCFCESCGLQP